MLTVRQRQQAVRVWAMRLWPVVVVPSSGGCGAPSVLVCVAVATSIARRSQDGRTRTRELAYDARPGMWGRSTRTSMPERFVAPARFGPVLSVRRDVTRWRCGIRQRHLVYGMAKQYLRSVDRWELFNQKNKARRRKGHKKTPAHYRATPIRRRKKEDEA